MNFPKNIFMPFVVIGDPNYDQSLLIIKSLIANGAGALELGFAFSDPIADGPVIQSANKRALENGINVSKTISILKSIRSYSNIPISLMLSFNLVYNYGIENFYRVCDEFKINAVLCPDVSLEESAELLSYSKKYGIDQVFLVSSMTNKERMIRINNYCSGYAYLVSLLGTTGVRSNLSSTLPALIRNAKDNINVPVYVGFGISRPEHIIEVINMGADGAITGSAICKIIENNLCDFRKMEEEIGVFCRNMSEAVVNIYKVGRT